MSTNTGVAPTALIATTVGAAVFETVITSSPGPMPRARRPSTMALVPLSTPTQWATSWYAANSCSKPRTLFPSTSCPELNTVSTASRMSARSFSYSGK